MDCISGISTTKLLKNDYNDSWSNFLIGPFYLRRFLPWLMPYNTHEYRKKKTPVQHQVCKIIFLM